MELDALRVEIESYTGAPFAAKRAAIVAKVAGLSAVDKDELRKRRDWRNLVEGKFTTVSEADDIKALLGIPR